MDGGRTCGECGSEILIQEAPDLCPDCLAKLGLARALTRLMDEFRERGGLLEREAMQAILAGRESLFVIAERALKTSPGTTTFDQLTHRSQWKLFRFRYEDMAEMLKRLEDE